MDSVLIYCGLAVVLWLFAIVLAVAMCKMAARADKQIEQARWRNRRR